MRANPDIRKHCLVYCGPALCDCQPDPQIKTYAPPIPRRPPAPDECWQHFKGDTYVILAVSRHTEQEDQRFVIYRRFGDTEIWARPLEMFMGYVDAETPRFRKLGGL